MANRQNDPKDTKETKPAPAPGTPGAAVSNVPPVQGPRTESDPDQPRPPAPVPMGAPGGVGTAQPGEVVPPASTTNPPDTSFHDRARELQDDNARRQADAVARGLAPVAVLAPGAAAAAAAGLAAQPSGVPPVFGNVQPSDRAATVGEPEIVPETSGQQVPPHAMELLFDVCERFGVNPLWDADPRELADWRYHPANRRAGKKEGVTIVTAGGTKITQFTDGSLDEDTEERLRGIFQSYTFNAAKQRVELPLPDNMVLPASNTDGQVRTAAHVVRASWRRGGVADPATVNPQQAAQDEANRKAAALRGDRHVR